MSPAAHKTPASVESGAMRRFALAPGAKQAPSRADGPAEALLALQQSAGNHAVTELLRGSSGRPLDRRTRQEMETKFGADFGDVRVHTGEIGAHVAFGAGARAVTSGRNIAFSEGFYAPSRSEGKRLIAHELAHLLQQGRPGGRESSAAGAEAEARQAGSAVAAGRAAGVRAAATGAQADPLTEEEKRRRSVEQMASPDLMETINQVLPPSPPPPPPGKTKTGEEGVAEDVAKILAPPAGAAQGAKPQAQMGEGSYPTVMRTPPRPIVADSPKVRAALDRLSESSPAELARLRGTIDKSPDKAAEDLGVSASEVPFFKSALDQSGSDRTKLIARPPEVERAAREGAGLSDEQEVSDKELEQLSTDLVRHNAFDFQQNHKLMEGDYARIQEYFHKKAQIPERLAGADDPKQVGMDYAGRQGTDEDLARREIAGRVGALGQSTGLGGIYAAWAGARGGNAEEMQAAGEAGNVSEAVGALAGGGRSATTRAPEEMTDPAEMQQGAPLTAPESNVAAEGVSTLPIADEIPGGEKFGANDNGWNLIDHPGIEGSPANDNHLPDEPTTSGLPMAVGAEDFAGASPVKTEGTFVPLPGRETGAAKGIAQNETVDAAGTKTSGAVGPGTPAVPGVTGAPTPVVRLVTRSEASGAAPAKGSAAVPPPPPGMSTGEMDEAKALRLTRRNARLFGEKTAGFDAYIGGKKVITSVQNTQDKNGSPIVIHDVERRDADDVIQIKTITQLDKYGRPVTTPVPDLVAQNVSAALRKAYNQPVTRNRPPSPLPGTNIYERTNVVGPKKITILVQVPGEVTSEMGQAAMKVLEKDTRLQQLPPVEVIVQTKQK